MVYILLSGINKQIFCLLAILLNNFSQGNYNLKLIFWRVASTLLAIFATVTERSSKNLFPKNIF